MGSLADQLDGARKPEPLGRVDVGPDGGEFTDIRTTEPISDWSGVFRRFNLDPDVFEIVGDTVRMSSWQQSARTADGDRDLITLYSYRAQFTRRTATIDLPALYAAVRPYKPRTGPKPTANGQTLVVCLSDVQAGKTGSRGGTPELVQRMAEKRAALRAHMKATKPADSVLLEVGDLFEGFESGGNPMFTNDLSLAQQMDLAATELYEFIRVMVEFGPVRVVGVPSNHTAWRAGKQNLGNPQDDLGLLVHRNVQRVCEAAGLPVSWVFPRDFDEAAVIDVQGTLVGCVHGNQFSRLQAVQWWAKQQHGGQPVGACDVLVSGHYHQLTVMPSGRNPHTGRSKWWLQCPTLDNGSDWFRNTAGEDSDPGLLTFAVGSEGFELSSLTVL